MFKNIFVIAVCVVGVVEWLKNLLPQNIKDNKIALAVISGVVSIVGSVLFVAFGQTLGLVEKLDNTYWLNYVIYSASTLGIVQVNYTTLLKVFKSLVEKLKTKYSSGTVDEDKLSDEIIELIESKVTAAVADAMKTTTTTTTKKK